MMIKPKFIASFGLVRLAYERGISDSRKKARSPNYKNIAGRSPENSRNSFVDLQSQKTVKRQTKKKFLFIKSDAIF